MACLDLLPTETLLNIFGNLSVIDDANHLARCNKYLSRIFTEYRFNIFKSIIIKSDYHKFDVRLCMLNKAVFDFATQHDHWVSPSTQLPPDITDYSKGRSHADCRPAPSIYYSCTPAGKEPMSSDEMDAMLTPEVVWDIVTRWGALQLLPNIYMGRAVNGHFVDWVRNTTWAPSIDNHTDPHIRFDRPAIPQDIGITGSLPLRQDLPLRQNMSCTNRGRFYKAVIAIWLMQETCMLLKMTKWETQTQFMDAAYELRTFSPCTTSSAIQEDMETLEVLDFLVTWCIPRVFGWPSRLDEFITKDIDLPDEPYYYWLKQMRIMYRILRPSDVLELLLMSANGVQNLCLSQEYLRLRGAFERVNYESWCYWPAQRGSVGSSQWRHDEPCISFDRWAWYLSCTQLSADWIEKDILRRLSSTTTNLCDWPVDHPVPRLYGYHVSPRSRPPFNEGTWFKTSVSFFPMPANEATRRQHRLTFAFNCFRQVFWPKEIRGKVFEKEDDMDDEDFVNTLERVRLTDEYKVFAETEYAGYKKRGWSSF